MTDQSNSTQVDNLLTQLSEAQVQLQHVENLITADPNNAEYQSLKRDLEELITLRQRLLKEATGKARGVKRKLDETAATPDATATVASTAQIAFAAGLQVGDRCRAVWPQDGKVYLAKVAVAWDNETRMLQVVYLRFGNAANVSAGQVMPWEQPKLAEVGVGSRVIAPVESGGWWYSGVVVEVLVDARYRVKFRQQPGVPPVEAEVALNDLVLDPERVDVVRQPDAVPDELHVPEHLQVRPTDSEATKKRKLQKTAKLEKRHSRKKAEAAVVQKTRSWQNFRKKKTKRGRMSKQSIFASPDTVDGRVGVVGSGKKMTEYKELDARRVRRTG